MPHVRRTSLILVALLLFATTVWAQGDQTVNFYIVPLVMDSVHGDTRVPKYLSSLTTPNWVTTQGDGTSVMPYGLEMIALVGANLTAAEHASVAAQPDVLTFPPGNLDNAVTTLNLTTLQTALEGVNIPAGWINGTHTYREVVRFVRQLFTFSQRYFGEYSTSIFTGGITLGTRWNQLPTAAQNRLRAIADQLQLVTTGITPTSTMRQILRLLGPQLPPVNVMGVPNL